MREEWREYEGTGYKVSSLGRVIGRRGKLLRLSEAYNGYRVFSVGGKVIYVHRAVALAFLGEAPGKQVDHIDGDKSNNALDNLRWVTGSENMAHSYALGRRSNRTSRKGVPVVMIRGDEKRTFASMSEAARAVNKTQARIWQAVEMSIRCAGARWERA